jgi:hypothetical protein
MALTLGVGVLAAGQTAFAAGPVSVGLGTAARFALLAGTPAITNTGNSSVTGDVGIAPASAVTGFPPGAINGATHAADAVAVRAKSDLTTAYLDAAGRPSSATHGTLGGLTLPGGVYDAGGVTLDLTGTLVLDGENDPNSVWIFQATSDLVTASSSAVRFINGGQACNVFWQVTSSATLGSGSTFAGTIMALTSITMDSGVTLTGRALARNGQVTLIDDTITRSTCAAAAPTATPTSSASTTPAPGGSASTPPAPTITTPPTDIVMIETAASGTPGSATLVAILLVGILLAVSILAVSRRSRRMSRPR